MSQLTRKVIINKNFHADLVDLNFKNKDLDNFVWSKTEFLGYKKHKIENELIAPFQKKYLNKNELELFEKKYNINVSNSPVLTSTRCKINNQIYHSIDYRRKGNTNSYSVFFFDNDQEKIGNIHNFVEIDGKIYVFIKEFETLSNIDILLPKSLDIRFSQFINNDSFQKYFKFLDKTRTELNLIETKFVNKRAILIENKHRLFCSKLVYDFEHD